MARALDDLFEDEIWSPSKKHPKRDGCQEGNFESGFTAYDREFLKQCFSALSVGFGSALCPVQQKLSKFEEESKQLQSRLYRLELANRIGMTHAVEHKIEELEARLRTSLAPVSGLLQDSSSQRQALHANTGKDVVSDECLQQLGKQLQSRLDVCKPARQIELELDLQSQYPARQQKAKKLSSSTFACDLQPRLKKMDNHAKHQADDLEQAHEVGMAVATQRRTDAIEAASNPCVTLPSCFFWKPNDSQSNNPKSRLEAQHPIADRATNPTLLGLSEFTNVVVTEKGKMCVDQDVDKPMTMKDLACVDAYGQTKMSQGSQSMKKVTSSTRTMMICNLPCRVTHADLVEAINSVGFVGKFDSVRLPSRVGQAHSNLGYGFVQFFHQMDANKFALAFEGYRFSHRESTKSCTIKVADRQAHLSAVNRFAN